MIGIHPLLMMAVFMLAIIFVVAAIVNRVYKFRSGAFNDATPQLESFLAKHGRKSTGLLGFNKGLRYAEGVLEEGELVAVFGREVWENDGSGTRRLVISKPRDGHLRVSDNPSTLCVRG